MQFNSLGEFLLCSPSIVSLELELLEYIVNSSTLFLNIWFSSRQWRSVAGRAEELSFGQYPRSGFMVDIDYSNKTRAQVYELLKLLQSPSVQVSATRHTEYIQLFALNFLNDA
jgi:hypothetical protein